MTLGPAKWTSAKPFYDALTLATDGDSVEQEAAQKYGLDKRFRHYEIFWKRHICPATERPHGITFRPGVADIISVLAQRSYTVLVYMLESFEYLGMVKQGSAGPRQRHCYISLMFAGNALQVFTELQRALSGSPSSLSGMKDLATEIGTSISLFPDWDTHWKPARESAVNYRHYLTHQGRFYSVLQQATGQILVLKRSAFKPNMTHTWTHAESDYISRPANWIDLADACQDVFDDTLDLLERAYQQIVTVLDPFLLRADYQRLWGWQDRTHTPVPAALRSASSGTVPTAPVWMTGSTASGVDERPPGSGEMIV